MVFDTVVRHQRNGLTYTNSGIPWLQIYHRYRVYYNRNGRGIVTTIKRSNKGCIFVGNHIGRGGIINRIGVLSRGGNAIVKIPFPFNRIGGINDTCKINWYTITYFGRARNGCPYRPYHHNRTIERIRTPRNRRNFFVDRIRT